jgi:hypothetical protein
MREAERSPYGIEWYWLTPEERKEVLRISDWGEKKDLEKEKRKILKKKLAN